jgi:23S rRNA pseudouridine955/2504/2580 synthase
LCDYFTLVVTEDEAGMRLDRWIRKRFSPLSQACIQQALRRKVITCNHTKVPARHAVQAHDRIQIAASIQPSTSPEPAQRHAQACLDLAAQLRPLIVYRDDTLCALNKPNGIATQGGTAIIASIDHALPLLMVEEDNSPTAKRPHLVHRLDKDTSGLLLFALSRTSAQYLTALFAERAIEKTYRAYVHGIPPHKQGCLRSWLASDFKHHRERVVSAPAPFPGALEAITHYTVLQQTMLPCGLSYAEVLLAPVTGRKHQLRVQMAEMGSPIVGDRKYGTDTQHPSTKRLYLHAHTLALTHPKTQARMVLTAPLPNDWQNGPWHEKGASAAKNQA